MVNFVIKYTAEKPLKQDYKFDTGLDVQIFKTLNILKSNRFLDNLTKYMKT